MGARFVSSILVALYLSLVDASLAAQSKRPLAVERRLDSLEKTVLELRAEIATLSRLLRLALPPSPIEELPPTDVAYGRVRGAEQARVVVVEFADFECPFCGQYAAGVYQQIQTKFVDTGKIRYAFRHLPLEVLHPRARRAAEAAECAGEQGRFWEFHDRLFVNQKALAPTDLVNHARSLNLAMPAFEACFGEHATADKVALDLADAKRLGLTATPAFMIGEIQRAGTVKVTRRVVGAQPFPVMEAVLNELLSKSPG